MVSKAKSKKRGRKEKPPYAPYRESETQTIHRKNYAPMGRPPSEALAKQKYDKAKSRPTRYAKKRK